MSTEVEAYTLTNRKELVAFLKVNKYVMLKAGATWCKPCKRSTPIFMSHFAKLPKFVKLVLVDIDAGDDIAALLKIKSVPHFAFYIEQEAKRVCIRSNEKDLEDFYQKVGKDIMIYSADETGNVEF